MAGSFLNPREAFHNSGALQTLFPVIKLLLRHFAGKLRRGGLVMDARRDMTVGTEWKELLIFSLPIMAGQFLQQLYNTVDSIVVSRYGGETQAVSDAMFAAVGSCTSLIFLFLAISLGLANGGGVLIAQLYGARREHELRRAASTLLITQAALGLLLAVIGSFGARLLVVGLMRVTDEACREYAIEYFAIYAVGLIFQYIYNAVAGILRAVGDSKASMYFLFVSAGLNTVLDLWFVISFGWGVVGVAVATVIAQAVCAAFSIFYMFRRYPIFRFRRSEFVFDTGKFRVCIRLGVPAIIQQAVVSLGNVFIQRLVNDFGQVTMSAFNAGNRMESYALIPIFGMNNAMASFTGQNVGAQKYDRVHRGFRAGTAMSCCMSLCVSALLFFLAPDFARLFSLSGEALAQAVEYQRFMSLCIILFASYMPASGLLQGAGDVLWTSMMSFSTLALRVAASYTMFYALSVRPSACWWNIPFGWGLGCLLAFPRYRSKRWMSKRVVGEVQKD